MSTARLQRSGYLSEGLGRIKNMLKDILGDVQVNGLIFKGQLLQILIPKPFIQGTSWNIRVILRRYVVPGFF